MPRRRGSREGHKEGRFVVVVAIVRIATRRTWRQGGAVSRDGGGERGEEIPRHGNECGRAPFGPQRAPVVVGCANVGNAGIGGARGGGDVGVPQVWPAK